MTVSKHQMRCVIVLPPRHPLAAHKLLTPALLSGHPMVAPVRSLQLPPKLQATFAAAGAQLNAVVEAEFLASLCGLVAAGTGWSLVDPAVGRKLQPSRPGRAAVRAGHSLRSRRLPSPRPRALDAGRRLPRAARGQAGRLRRQGCVSTPGLAAELLADRRPVARLQRHLRLRRQARRHREREARLRPPARAGARGLAGQFRPLDSRALWRLAGEDGVLAPGRRHDCAAAIRWCAPSPRRRTASRPR